MERMMENFFIACAVRGSSSEICTPGTVVGMALKLPRTSDGASGLGSKVSSWLAPPFWKNTMHETSGCVLARSNRGRSKPPNASVPALRKSRRVEPITCLPSVVQLKFFGVEHRPQHILQCAPLVPACRFLVGQVLRERLAFLFAGRTRVGPLKQVGDNLRIAHPPSG